MRFLRFVVPVLALILVSWLWKSGQCRQAPWRCAEFLDRAVVTLPAEESAELRAEVALLAEAAGVEEVVNLNGAYDDVALNVYIVRKGERDAHGLRPGDARYKAGSDALLIDERIVWPIVSRVNFAGVAIASPDERSSMARLWFSAVLLHELGHRQLHRFERPSEEQPEGAELERQADVFAFDTLAQLISDRAIPYNDSGSLFSASRIHSLSEPDRSIAIIASVIQGFSVNLLFSDVAFSSFHSDPAHRAFADRFRPYLSHLMTRASTREGKTFVLLAMVYVDRVAAAGAHVLAELVSEEPIADVRFHDGKLALRSAAGTPDVVVSLAGLEGERSRPLVVHLDGASARTASEGAITAIGEGAAPGEGPSPSWWADREEPPTQSGVTDAALVEELGGIYFLGSDPAPCAVRRSQAIGQATPIVFSCGSDYFTAELDELRGELVNVQFHNGPDRVPGDSMEIVDVGVGKERKTIFFQNTLSDRPHAHRHQITAWLASGARPRELARSDLATDWIPTGSMLLDWFRISHPSTLICRANPLNLVSCAEFLDSVFFFDLVTQDMGVLFYPAGARMINDGEGRYAFFTPGGFRVFVSSVSLRKPE